MKRFLSLVLLLLLTFLCCACDSHKGHVQIAGVWVDQEGVNKFSKAFAETNGDSYCKRCKKVIEGKARVCPYCGKYI